MLKFFFLFFTNPVFASDTITPYLDRYNKLELFLYVVSGIVFVLMTFLFSYLAFKFRRKNKEEQGGKRSHHNTVIEVVWTVIPLLVFLIMFVWGWVVYKDFYTPPKNPLEIHVYGQKWSWEFVYKNGKKSTKDLYVPVDRPVKLIMTSRDVIHSFYIPTFKIKKDVVPGTYSSIHFEAKREGKFYVFCTEFCGDKHSSMVAFLHVVPLKEWEKWLAHDPYKGLSLPEVGKKAFQGRCTACHKTTTEKFIGPGLAGIFNTQRKLKDGKEVLADENYLRESILNPGAKISFGYENQMTPFAGILTEEELTGLVEYIKTLKN